MLCSSWCAPLLDCGRAWGLPGIAAWRTHTWLTPVPNTEDRQLALLEDGWDLDDTFAAMFARGTDHGGDQ